MRRSREIVGCFESHWWVETPKIQHAQGLMVSEALPCGVLRNNRLRWGATVCHQAYNQPVSSALVVLWEGAALEVYR